MTIARSRQSSLQDTPYCPKRWLSHIPFPYDGAILVTSCAISAITELAVQRAEQTGLILVGFCRAEQTGLTLVGFCRPGRAEIYSGS
ncbi:hypothetical protein CF111_17130 [Aeromonas sobria]|uniref:hypothetical protein n=1 Tax=Aeromonas sobria TaxID=646 RepID=UPI0011183322|nr:hypothetical protein [Aeromonas sobria]TNJ18338.1 hypothetical protein CF111_17130 [Aeromonas sobria]